ncbi:MAG: protein tyrosine kinase modulator [Candidatus Petromonas sp.]|jgi:capsular polysaccharide biosynthesis protein|nr:protein tyrosine kinase modulator [Candidatus Petromonas sp.]
MEVREYEIDLREYFEIIRKRIWIIILLMVVSVTISGIISYFVLPPIYETSATLMVSKPINQDAMIQYSDVLLNQKLVKTYGEIIKSRSISSQVIENLDLDTTPQQLKEKVTVSPVKDTEIIQIKVTHTDPVLGTKIANELARVFMKDVTRIMKIDNVQVIDKAVVPHNPVKPRPLLNMVIAGFLGVMIGLGIVFLIEYLDNTIKTPNDVERYLELPIIGAIPNMDEVTKA